MSTPPRSVPPLFVLARVVGLVFRHRLVLGGAAAAALLAAVFSLATPRLLGAAIDHIEAVPRASEGAAQALWMTAGLLVLAACLRGIFQALAGHGGEWVGQRVAYGLRIAYFGKLQDLDFAFHDKADSADLITRGMLDIEGVRGFIEMGMQRILQLLLLLGVGAVGLFSVDPLLALLSLSFVPVVAWRAGVMGLGLRRIWTKLQQKMSRLTLVMEENLRGVRVVRAFAARRHEMLRFDRASREALSVANTRVRLRATSAAIMSTSFYAAMAAVLWFGGQKIAAGALTVGRLAEFLTFMAILQAPVRQIGMIVNSGARAASAGARLFEVLDVEPRIKDAPGAKPLMLSRGEIRFENVGFSYPGDAPALRDVSFSTRIGSVLGVVGPAGAGKSTIAHLLARFYDVDSGKITIDGQDIRDVTLRSLRAAVSVVPQDVFLFDASARDNLAYAEPEASEASLRAAAQTSQIHDHLQSQPQGYAMRVGERGVGLSGGQRQRLSIGRGLLRTPPILVLDDATSALDSGTEQKLKAALLPDAARRATIIIAHRLATLRHADQIIVLDEGRIVERGDHDALMALGGRYAALANLQAGTARAMRPQAPIRARGHV